MAEITWHTRHLNGGRVLLSGRTRLRCDDTLVESVQVRDNPHAIQTAKAAIKRRLASRTTEHATGCTE